jgi:hypothetical protein
MTSHIIMPPFLNTRLKPICELQEDPKKIVLKILKINKYRA